MKTYFWNEFKFYRKKKGGNWVKTKERGWMTLSNYRLYLSYRYDPIFIKEEKINKNKINNIKNKQ
jgi:hypothetical protein